MTTTNYNIRLDQELKENAFSVFESYGLTPSQAIKLFLTQVAQTNKVPLSFEYQKVAAVSQDELPIYKEHTDWEKRWVLDLNGMNKKTSPISANTVYHLRQLPGFFRFFMPASARQVWKWWGAVAGAGYNRRHSSLISSPYADRHRWWRGYTHYLC